MTTLDDRPTTAPTPPPDPTRSPLGRALAWTGGIVGGLLILGGAVSVAGQLAATTVTAHESFPASDVVELVADGHVTVAVGGSTVEVDRTARYAFGRPTFTSEVDGDRLVVSHLCRSWVFSNCTASLDVTLPADTRLVVRTSNGQIRASGLTGDADLRTSNGRVAVSQIGGDLRVRTSNGEVTVADVGGDAVLGTSNGTIHVGGVDGSVEARSSNGEVRVDDVGGAAYVRSSNGGLEVAAVRGDVDAQTSNGSVTVRGTGEPVALDISTSNGRQTVDAPTDPDADVQVRISSSSGDVSYLGPRG
jgi:hypothetical protein